MASRSSPLLVIFGNAVDIRYKKSCGNTETVTDISPACLSACGDNKRKYESHENAYRLTYLSQRNLSIRRFIRSASASPLRLLIGGIWHGQLTRGMTLAFDRTPWETFSGPLCPVVLIIDTDSSEVGIILLDRLLIN